MVLEKKEEYDALCSKHFFPSGPIERYKINTKVAHSDSWIQLNICNEDGECCTSQKFTNLEPASINYRNSDTTDPCNGFLMERGLPDGNGQTVEVDHFGTDGVILQDVSIHLVFRTYLVCEHPNNPTENIVLLAGAGVKLMLKCRTVIIVP